MRNYEKLFAYSADFMCELDGGSRVTNVNPAMRRQLGATEVRHRPFASLFDRADTEQVASTCKLLSSARATATTEARLLDERSNTVWTSWHLTAVANDSIVAIGRDITRRHEIEKDLATKTNFLHSIIEAEPECVKVLSRTGELIDMNATGLRMVGANKREEVIGSSIYKLIAPEDLDAFRAFNEQVCAGKPGSLDFAIISLDGTRRAMQTKAVPLRGRSPSERLHLAITRDVSEQRAWQAQARQAQRLEAFRQLAGGIAHDFNNLLTAIIGPAEMAVATLGDGHPVAGDLQTIQATAERAGRLTRQLMAFSRLQDVPAATLDLPQLVASTKATLTQLIGASCTLELAISNTVQPVNANRGQLEQVLINLVVNARDALELGGHIRVAVFDEEITDRRATRLGCKPGPHVALSVGDDGTGIAGDVLPHIFEPLFTTKAAGSGTGLGLATCMSIAKNFDGAIDVLSTPGVGATFTLLLPVSEGPVLIPLPPQPPARGHAERILLVEDDEPVRVTVSRMLRTLGYEVETANNAEQVLQRMGALKTFALVISDMTMPGMGGQQLARELHHHRADLPIVLMTGYLSGGEDLTELDQHTLLHKPFTSQELNEAVRGAIEGTAPPSHRG